MKQRNPFERKYIERLLFRSCKSQAMDKRRCRTYLRKLARHIERAWEVGHMDGLDGKPLVPLEELTDNGDSSMGQMAIRWAYTAYRNGHKIGAAERRGAYSADGCF